MTRHLVDMIRFPGSGKLYKQNTEKKLTCKVEGCEKEPFKYQCRLEQHLSTHCKDELEVAYGDVSVSIFDFHNYTDQNLFRGKLKFKHLALVNLNATLNRMQDINQTIIEKQKFTDFVNNEEIEDDELFD